MLLGSTGRVRPACRAPPVLVGSLHGLGHARALRVDVLFAPLPGQVGCIVEHEGRILLCRRGIEPQRGLWTVPAGQRTPAAACTACWAMPAWRLWPQKGCLLPCTANPAVVCTGLRPAGYMECGESSAEGAARETWEEAGARVEVQAPYSHYDIPGIGQTCEGAPVEVPNLAAQHVSKGCHAGALCRPRACKQRSSGGPVRQARSLPRPPAGCAHQPSSLPPQLNPLAVHSADLPHPHAPALPTDLLFRARLAPPFTFAARRPESLEARLFAPGELPWSELAFSSVAIALRRCGWGQGSAAGRRCCRGARVLSFGERSSEPARRLGRCCAP